MSIEKDYQRKEANLFGQARSEHEKAKQDCLRENNIRLEKLRETLVEEELELERKYLKFEENLHNNK